MKKLALILSLIGSTAFAQDAPISVIPWLSDAYGAVVPTPDPTDHSQVPSAPSAIETGGDRMLALHAIAWALTAHAETRWINTQSGNAGKVIIIEKFGYRGCKIFKNFLLIQNTLPAHEEVMEACPGGGNSNTWIIDNKWHISSVDRQGAGRCSTRFTDARVDRGRMTGEAKICWMNYGGQTYFNVEG